MYCVLLVADTARCMGTGVCRLICPEVFGQDEEGIVKVLNSNPPKGLRAAVEEAVADCPTTALTVSIDD